MDIIVSANAKSADISHEVEREFVIAWRIDAETYDGVNPVEVPAALYGRPGIGVNRQVERDKSRPGIDLRIVLDAPGKDSGMDTLGDMRVEKIVRPGSANFSVHEIYIDGPYFGLGIEISNGCPA